MKTLLIIPIIALTVYLLYVYWRHGMTYSISATYQKLNTKEKILLPITLWCIAFPIMIVGMYEPGVYFARGLFFVAGFFLLLISVAPMYWKNETLNNRQQAFMHYLGSYGGIGTGMIACLIYYSVLLTWVLVILYGGFVLSQFFIKKLRIPNHVYWLEVIALIIISTILYLN